MKATFHYKKWWHRFSPRHRREKEATEQITNFILKKYEKQITDRAIAYIKDWLINGRTN